MFCYLVADLLLTADFLYAVIKTWQIPGDALWRWLEVLVVARSGFRVIIFNLYLLLKFLKSQLIFCITLLIFICEHLNKIFVWGSFKIVCIYVLVVDGHSSACLLRGKKFGGKNLRCRLSCINSLHTYEYLTVMLTYLKVGILPTPEIWNIFQTSGVWVRYNDSVISKT
jgi:hypothetical protein